jgi:hypothetical protein
MSTDIGTDNANVWPRLEAQESQGRQEGNTLGDKEIDELEEDIYHQQECDDEEAEEERPQGCSQ